MAEDVVLQSDSPNGNAEAVVEDDGRAVYLYQHFAEGTGQELRATWVRNRVAAPPEVVTEDMQQGLAPLMPARFCAHPEGQPKLDPTRTRLVWLPDGNGVALYEGPELIACTAPWHGVSDCPGYARDVTQDSPFAWRFEPTSPLAERFKAAARYWDSWQSKLSWEVVRKGLRDALGRALGREVSHREDALAWPPLGLATFESERGLTTATVGMSQRPMPGVELAHADAASQFRRVELAVMLPHGAPEVLRERMGGFLTLASELPWNRYSWLGHGHTIPVDAFKDTPYAAVVLASSERFGPAVPLPPVDGDPVTLLWLVPITAAEAQAARGGGADAFLAKLTQPRALAEVTA